MKRKLARACGSDQRPFSELPGIEPGSYAFPQGFSVRSSLCLYSDLLITQTSQDDDPSRCKCPDESRDRNSSVDPSS